jgi:hypothetical protein
VNGGGRMEGKNDETQSRRRMAEKVEVGGYPELRPVYDGRVLTPVIQQ